MAMSYDDYVKQGLTPDKLMQFVSGGNQFGSQARGLAEAPVPEQPAQSGTDALNGSSQNAQSGPPPQDQGLNGLNPYLAAQLTQSALTPEQERQLQGDLGEQRKGADYIKGLQQMAGKMPLQTDLSPLLALSDSLTGSNLTKGYTKPQTGEDRVKQLGDLEKMSQDQRNKVSQDLIKLYTGKNAGAQLRAAAQAASLQLRETTNAQKQFNDIQKPNIQRVEGATRIKDIFDGIKQGTVAGNRAAKSLANAEIQRLETGAGNSAFEGQKQKDQDTGKEQLAELFSFLDAHPRDTVPPEILQNIENMSKSLSSSYTNAMDTATRGLIAGSRPLQKQIYQQKHDELKSLYTQRLGGWGKDLTANTAVVSGKGGPKVGDVVDGHQYLGGDPGSQNSWKEIK